MNDGMGNSVNPKLLPTLGTLTETCKLSEIYASTELRQASLDSDDTAASLGAAIMRRMSEPEVKIRL